MALQYITLHYNDIIHSMHADKRMYPHVRMWVLSQIARSRNGQLHEKQNYFRETFAEPSLCMILIASSFSKRKRERERERERDRDRQTARVRE